MDGIAWWGGVHPPPPPAVVNAAEWPLWGGVGLALRLRKSRRGLD